MSNPVTKSKWIAALLWQLVLAQQHVGATEDRPTHDPFDGPDEIVQEAREDGTGQESGKSAAVVLTLRATLVSKTPLVDINGELLGIGDVIEGYRVVSIIEGKVSLENSGHITVLELSTDKNDMVQ